MDKDKLTYEIVVMGSMGTGWADWFGDRETREEPHQTVLVLRDIDRATLYGTLRTLGDLDSTILSLRLTGGQP